MIVDTVRKTPTSGLVASAAMVLAFFVFHALPARAAVQFTALGGDVTQGSQITVPVTVTGFSSVGGMQFDLTYNSSLLTYQGQSSFGLPGLTSGLFGTPAPGILRLSWINPDLDIYPTGVSVSDDTTIFAVQFLANGGLGSSTIGFNITEVFDYTVPVPNAIDASFVVGNVNVVPEPVNIALGVFAGLFVGTGAVRRIFRKRSSGPTA